MRRSKRFIAGLQEISIFSSIRGLVYKLLSPCSVLRWPRLLYDRLLTAQAQTPAPQLSADLSHSPGWVVISVDDYQTLRAHAFPTDRPPDPPPVDATLTRVDYDLRIAGDLATGRASLTVDVLKDGWVRVPIPSGLLVREARLDGKLVSLVSGSGKSTSQMSAMLGTRRPCGASARYRSARECFCRRRAHLAALDFFRRYSCCGGIAAPGR